MTTTDQKMLTTAFLAALLVCPLVLAGGAGPEEGSGLIVIGAQDRAIDADRGDAGFEKNDDHPSGVVLDYLRWATAENGNWFQVKAWDVTQRDERVALRAGFGRSVRFKVNYGSLPYRAGDGARFVLGQEGSDAYGPLFRIGDFIQQRLQDPDGDGTDFYTSSAETTEDNGLTQTLARDLLSGTDPISIDSHRKAGGFAVTVTPARELSFDFSVDHEARDGTQPLGSGTYQRVSDVNGDGTTDYDYYFSTRGIELPAPIDYRTTRLSASGSYGNRRGFLNLGWALSDFDNDNLGVTYDNPFWFDGVNGSSGSRRGLWEEGRASLEPSNQAWDLTASGGVNLDYYTRITASISRGKHTQDAPFLPITTNPATIGTADINRDGTVDAQDDPTATAAAIAGMPATIDGTRVIGNSLDAESDTMALNLAITSRPAKGLKLTGRLRSYEYAGQEGIQVVPARTEYIESRVKLDFKHDLILHVPLDFTRRTFDLEAAYKPVHEFQVKGFYRMKTYDWDRYQDPDDNSSRDSGTRAVGGTDDDILGVSARFAYLDNVTGRVTYQHAARDYDETYTPGFSGENSLLRQYDIAERDRDSFDVQVDVMPHESTTLGFGYNHAEDDYPETALGLTGGQTDGVNVNFNYAATKTVSLFAYADRSEWDADMHLRTKCANCSTPPGSSPWDVPNYDWHSTYNDETISFGGGLKVKVGPQTRLSFSANYLQGTIEQTTRNPGGLPTELNPDNTLFGETSEVARGYDFPNQESTLVSTELTLTHKLTDRFSLGLWWLFEDYDLEDFQWDGMQPYGADFLAVDDPTRLLFLDSRYSDYTAHVFQAFMKLRF